MTTTTIPHQHARLMRLLGDANNVLIEEGLLARGWRIRFNNNKRQVGQCDVVTKTITVSLPFARLNTDAEVWDTFMHEIAHALTDLRAPDHGDEWKANAVRLGARPTYRTSRDAVSVPGRYMGICQRCDTVAVYRYKRTESLTRTGWVHKGCGGSIRWYDSHTDTYLR